MKLALAFIAGVVLASWAWWEMLPDLVLRIMGNIARER